jgi:hypothetical protein
MGRDVGSKTAHAVWHHRTRLVLRLIAVERSLRGVLLLAAGTYLLFHLSTMCCSQPSWGYT